MESCKSNGQLESYPSVKEECFDLTIVAYFDDPIFPYALKELVN